MFSRILKNTLPALVIVWGIYLSGLIASDIEHEGSSGVYYLQQLTVFISYTMLGLVIGGIGAGILAKKKKKYSFYFESEQDKYYKYFLKNAGISLIALFSLTARELINHPMLYEPTLLNRSFWFDWIFMFLKDKFSPLYFTVFFIIIIGMSVHNLLYNLSIYHGVKRIFSYSFSVIAGIWLIFNFGYLNALDIDEEKNIIFIGVENLGSRNLTDKKIAEMPALKELTGHSYRFSNCFSVSNDPRVSLLSVLTSLHPEKGNYLGGYRSYGLEDRTVLSLLSEHGYKTGIFSDREFAFSRFNDKSEYLIKYPTNKELLKAKVLLSHFLMPVMYNSKNMIKLFPEALILDEYRDKTYLKGKVSELISQKKKFMFLYTISDRRDYLPFPFYRTSRFDNEENAFLNYLNDEVNNIFRRLKVSGKLGNTVICLFGLPEYSSSLKASDYKIPFIISYQGFEFERKVKNDYSSLDILPSVLDAAGLTDLIKVSDGVSFFDPEFVRQDIIITDVTRIRENENIFFRNDEGYVSKDMCAEREEYPFIRRAVIRGDYKLNVIPGQEGVDYELYDISRDPEETDNIINSNSSLARRMKNIFEEKLNKDFNLRMINGYALK